eukprot:TRINITY_DN29339_c0_g8_i1.p2 TRINITY_DN29339_c0_g8~~TRINITY_DN29339_c0_g8_i1.p2  ORF type:complete len:334 (+),score=110.29 TRINITY_DN29339_c0_g8_i1:75-1004(+)
MKHEASLVEVGPRDGLQYETVPWLTSQKIQLVDLLSQCGLRRIEVTSFVSPKVVPQLADAAEVLQGISKRPGVIYSALAPNLSGCRRALETPVDEIAVFVSASQTHNRLNLGRDMEDSLAACGEVCRLAAQEGRSLRGYVITAFGCPYEGAIAPALVEGVARAFQEMGVSEVSLGDTTGMANPEQVKRLLGRLQPALPGLSWAVHFHDSRGLGLANAYAAWQEGIRVFDSSVGGLGGCPTAKGAAGNIATEDLVNLLEELGTDTGVDFQGLLKAARLVEEVLDAPLASRTSRVGRPAWQGSEPGPACHS